MPNILSSPNMLNNLWTDTIAKQRLYEISTQTRVTAENTTFGMIDTWTFIFALLGAVIGIASLWYTYKTYQSQKETANNTRLLTLDAQRDLFMDLVRHLYRNLVVTYAIKTKLNDCHFKKYPSEIHLLKLKVPVEDIHLEVFSDDNKNYTYMNNLCLLFRNYNMEIDVAIKHFCNKEMDNEIKENDISTLIIKPGLISYRILDALVHVDKRLNIKKVCEEAIDIIRQSHEKNISENRFCTPWNGEYKEYDAHGDKFVTNIFSLVYGNEAQHFFTELFNQDARIECGKNSANGEKISMIDFS